MNCITKLFCVLSLNCVYLRWGSCFGSAVGVVKAWTPSGEAYLPRRYFFISRYLWPSDNYFDKYNYAVECEDYSYDPADPKHPPVMVSLALVTVGGGYQGGYVLDEFEVQDCKTLNADIEIAGSNSELQVSKYKIIFRDDKDKCWEREYSVKSERFYATVDVIEPKTADCLQIKKMKEERINYISTVIEKKKEEMNDIQNKINELILNRNRIKQEPGYSKEDFDQKGKEIKELTSKLDEENQKKLLKQLESLKKALEKYVAGNVQKSKIKAWRPSAQYLETSFDGEHDKTMNMGLHRDANKLHTYMICYDLTKEGGESNYATNIITRQALVIERFQTTTCLNKELRASIVVGTLNNRMALTFKDEQGDCYQRTYDFKNAQSNHNLKLGQVIVEKSVAAKKLSCPKSMITSGEKIQRVFARLLSTSGSKPSPDPTPSATSPSPSSSATSPSPS